MTDQTRASWINKLAKIKKVEGGGAPSHGEWWDSPGNMWVAREEILTGEVAWKGEATKMKEIKLKEIRREIVSYGLSPPPPLKAMSSGRYTSSSEIWAFRKIIFNLQHSLECDRLEKTGMIRTRSITPWGNDHLPPLFAEGWSQMELRGNSISLTPIPPNPGAF